MMTKLFLLVMTLMFFSAFGGKKSNRAVSGMSLLSEFVTDTILLSAKPESFKDTMYSIGKILPKSKTASFWTFTLTAPDSQSYQGTIDFAPSVNKGWVLWNVEVSCNNTVIPFDSLHKALSIKLGNEKNKYVDESERAVFWNLSKDYFLVLSQKPLNAEIIAISIRINEEYD